MKAKPIERVKKQVFKSDHRKQTLLFPPSLEELIDTDHPVRFIDEFVEEMDKTSLLSTYKGGGTSAYHPGTLLKLLLYGYLDRSYSSRVLEKQCKENICYMWLCGGQRPDHNTINKFRSERMTEDVKSIFKKVVVKAYEIGIIKLHTQIVDGTKLESVANRYSFVWSKNIARFKGNLEQKILGLLEEIDQIVSKEQQAPDDSTPDDSTTDDITTDDITTDNITTDNTSIDSESLAEKINELEDVDNKEVQKIVKQLKRDHLPKLTEYEVHQQILNGRSSYSKTDQDATFMRMKDDHMKNGQLKPAYNWVNSTENQFIINYTVHQNPNDATCYRQHTDDTLALLESESLPTFKRAMGDAGFGTEENYEYLEQKGIDNFLKFPSYSSEQKRKVKGNPFLGQNFFYNKEQDFLVCPMGQTMKVQSQSKQKRKSGYQAQVTIYQAQNCKGCPLRSLCQPAKNGQPINANRTVQINHNLEQHRQTARNNLSSLIGIGLRKKRSVDVEPVFGHIKYNRRFDRLTLTSLPKVNVEIGLLCIAHNLKKIWKFINQVGTGMPNPKNYNPIKAKSGLINQFFHFWAVLMSSLLVSAHNQKNTFYST